MEKQKYEMWILLFATLLLRIGFGASLILFDWTLVWAIEHALGVEFTVSVQAILLTSFATITYLVAEVILTGYYGNRSDRIGAKPVIMYATVGGGLALAAYFPASIFFGWTIAFNAYLALGILVGYMALIHFFHGVFASAKVAPSLGFINHLSTAENRTLHMSYYDNAILYGRTLGMILGGSLWIWFQVDHVTDINDQAWRIGIASPILGVLLIVSALIIKFTLSTPPVATTAPQKFSIKRDVSLAYSVMVAEKRRPLLLPWISIAGLIGSASVWGPSVAFRIASSEGSGEERGLTALLPIMLILIALALPAPIWGLLADKYGKKKVLQIGLIGMPTVGIASLAIGFPFYAPGFSDGSSLISNIPLLVSIMPIFLMFSAFIPVLMGSLGDTASSDGEKQDGHVMSGYHFIIAMGEIMGILVGGLFIGAFAIVAEAIPELSVNAAILAGFLIFELILILGMIIGILRLPDRFNVQTSQPSEVSAS